MNFKSITLALMLAMTSSAAMAIPYSPDYLQADQTDSETGSMQFIPKGNFESWSSQSIKESGIIGGNTVTLMHIGRPWGSSNGQKSVALPRPTSVCIVTRTPDTDIARNFTPTLLKQKCLASSISRCLQPAPYSLATHYNLSPTPKIRWPSSMPASALPNVRKQLFSIIKPILSKAIAYARMASQGVLLLPGRTWPIVYSTCKSVGKTPGATFMPSV